jgi:hypothetical protein
LPLRRNCWSRTPCHSLVLESKSCILGLNSIAYSQSNLLLCLECLIWGDEASIRRVSQWMSQRRFEGTGRPVSVSDCSLGIVRDCDDREYE